MALMYKTFASTAAAVLVASTVFAQADPSIRVARIGFLSGTVSFREASDDEWSPATLNYPVTLGDNLWTDRNGRGELQIGATVARLAESTAVSVLNLDEGVTQLRITEGSLSVRVRSIDDRDVVEIDTPNGAVSLLGPGFYRIDVNEAGDSSTITVRDGEAEVSSAGPAFTVQAGESAVVSGFDRPSYAMRSPTRPDEWEDWCLWRDRRGDAPMSTRYVSRGTVGYEDLDEFGTWRVNNEYGPVWVPNVRAGWVPYKFGRWVWIDPWGWTWVDDAPWGFAPFHYGRWAWMRDGWAWVPGTIVARPAYAPALVAFVGGSDWHVSLSIGSEPVAWFPLGPREVYRPGYRHSSDYLRRVNVTNVSVTNINVTNVTYVNRGVPGAVTAVPRETFSQRRPVAAAAVAVPDRIVRNAPVAAAETPIAPRPPREVAVRRGDVPRPPPAVVNRPVVVRREPPASNREPLNRTTAVGRPPDPGNGDRNRPTAIDRPADADRNRPARVDRPADPGNADRNRPRAVDRPGDSGNPGNPGNSDRRVAPAPQPAPTPPERTAAPPAPPARPSRTASPDREAADVAARHAQERVDVESRHAAERAAIEAQRLAAERQAQADRAQAATQEQRVRDARDAEARQLRELEARQVREHQDVAARQQAERRQAPAASASKPPDTKADTGKPPDKKADTGKSRDKRDKKDDKKP